MKFSAFFTSFLLFLLIQTSVFADNKSDIYDAFVNNNMVKWKNVIDKMHLQKNKSEDLIKELVNYQYGYIGWCVGVDKDDEAEDYLDLAESYLEVLSKNKSNLSLVHGYKSAFYGLKISLNIMMAPFYGPRSVESADIAIEKDSKNPMGYIQKGHGEFNMPESFGGSKVKAIEYYNKAEQLMISNSIEISNDWNYLSLLTFIAQSYSEIGQLEKAKDIYQKILSIEPEYQRVKNELYPEFLKKYKDGNK